MTGVGFPLSVGRIFELGWSIFRFGWRKSLAIALVCLAPAYLLNAAVSGAYAPAFNSWLDAVDSAVAVSETPPPMPDDVRLGLLLLLVCGLVLVVAGLFANAAVVHLAATIFRGGEASGRRSLDEAFSRLPALLAAQLIYLLIAVVMLVIGVGLGGGMLLFGGALAFLGLIVIVSALAAIIFLGVRLSLVQQAIMLDRLGPIEALGRSWVLASGSGWRILGYLILTGLLAGLVGIVFSGIPGVIVRLNPQSFNGVFVGTLIDGVANVLVVPLVPIVFNLLFFDLRFKRGEPPVPEVAVPAGDAAPSAPEEQL